MRSILLLAISLMPLFSAHALQVKAVEDNHSISVDISDKEISRLAVIDGRIQAIHGNNGAYELMKDEDNGAIFIKPTPFYYNRPFSLFLTTESGFTFNVLLKPKNMPADNILFQPFSTNKAIDALGHENHKEIISLLRAMAEENEEDFSVIDLEEAEAHYPSVDAEPLKQYQGDQLTGEIWCLRNKLDKRVALSPKEFYQEDDLAIALEADVLNPGEEAYLYRIKKNG